MDPRHPETALPRLQELLKQYARVEKDIERATIPAKLAELEREGALVVQEVSLVAPRLHERLMQASRNRRTAISRGLVEKPVENSVQSVGKESSEVAQSVEKTEVVAESMTQIRKKAVSKKGVAAKKKVSK